METDSFFYQLFNQLPETLFELLGLPPTLAKAYRFDSVELKKAYRIDGLFLPKRSRLPLYCVEVQFQRRPGFYANLFAKVFSYLGENDPGQDWSAVAIFPTRHEEPKQLTPYEDLLRSKWVRRIYLEDLTDTDQRSVGLRLLRLLFAPLERAQELVPQFVQDARTQLADSELQIKVIELMERLLLARFPELDQEAMRMKFKLHDLRESKAVQELCAESSMEGRTEGRLAEREETVRKCLAKGMTQKEVAELLELSVAEVRRLANGHAS